MEVWQHCIPDFPATAFECKQNPKSKIKMEIWQHCIPDFPATTFEYKQNPKSKIKMKLSKKSGKKKKVGKMRKEKGKKRKKNSKNKKQSEKSDFEKNRKNEREKYSRFCVDGYNSRVKHFSQIREHYFTYLQRVVLNNCVYCNSQLSNELLESLSLELEQNALLASLQVDIYERCMIRTISEIEKCTKEKQIFSEVKKLLPEPPQENHIEPLHINPKTEKSTSNTPANEPSQIPVLCNTRPDHDDNDSHENSHSEPVFNSHMPNPYLTDVIEYQNGCIEVDNNNIESIIENWQSNDCYSEGNDNLNFWCNDNEMQPSNDFDDNQTSSLTTGQPEEVDPLAESGNQLQQSVETSFNCKDQQEEKERAYIAHILQGDDSIDSLSDLENESKENVEDSTLMSRLEKMRELFGLDDEESQSETISNKPKEIRLKTKVYRSKRRASIWKHEKVIQLYKFSMLSSEMSFEKQIRNKRLFLQLFGEDSDEEHELEYRSEEKYRLSCTERISSWVVKYLMPYYHEKRIINRRVFKTLGHYVSETIIDKIQYPDEWTVKYFVSKFFPPTKKYICDADVTAFVPD